MVKGLTANDVFLWFLFLLRSSAVDLVYCLWNPRALKDVGALDGKMDQSSSMSGQILDPRCIFTRYEYHFLECHINLYYDVVLMAVVYTV